MSEYQQYKITYGIIVLNIIVYLLSSLLSWNPVQMDLEVLVEMGALFGPYTVLKGEWWRLFTAMFLHAGMTHILMNLVSLYIVGRALERYFSRNAYLVIYLFSGFAGGVASSFVHPLSVGIGASGAIFGVFGALAGFFLAYRHRIAEHTKAFMRDFGIIIAINVVLGLSIPSIDMSAHVGGLIVGFVGGFVLSKDPRLLLPFIFVMTFLLVVTASLLPGYYVQILS